MIGSTGGSSKPPSRAQRVGHLALLLLQLALVGQDLPRRAGVRGARLDAVGAGLEHLHQVGLGERALGLAHAGADPVSGDGSPDEDDEALVGAAHAGAAVGEAVDGELQLLVAAGAGSGGTSGGAHPA